MNSSALPRLATAPASESIERLLLDFLAYLELERGLSRNTLEAYRSDLLQFGEFLQRRGLSAVETGHSDLAAFLSELAGGAGERPPVAAATLQRKAACLRSFYRHLRREGLIEHDPTAELRGPPRTKRLPLVLSREEVGMLLNGPKGSEPRALRDRALLEVMYACGLRASEAIGLELADVDLEEGLLRARGKGSKERIVPVGREAVGALGVYLQRGRPVLVGVKVESRLFVNRRGSGLTRQGLYKIIQGHAERVWLAGQDEPAHAAPYLRYAPARRRVRSALLAGDAGARRSRHNPGLHASLGGAIEGRVLQRSSARQAVRH